MRLANVRNLWLNVKAGESHNEIAKAIKTKQQSFLAISILQLNHESFGWKLQKTEFIGDIGTVQSYLRKCGKRVNFGKTVVEIARKSIK